MASDDVQRFKPVGADGPEVVLASDFDAMRERAEAAERLLAQAAAPLQEADTVLLNVNNCSNNCQDCAGVAGEQASKIETFLASQCK